MKMGLCQTPVMIMGLQTSKMETKRSLLFIQAIRDVSLNDDTSLTGKDLKWLCNPPKEPLHVDDWYTELALSITYIKIQKAIKSFYQTKHLLTDLSGVTSVINHMCINSCTAYVGPLSDLDSCPECSKPQIRHSHVVFHMIPIAPQLQSLWWHPEKLQRNDGLVNSYNGIFCSQAYLDAVTQNRIECDDMLLMILIDGMQLYKSKESNCWIYIWIISQPLKLKIVNSFLFPGLHHLSAVQHKGLYIWDASQDCEFISHLFLFLACADGPGLLTLSNFVGHQGKNGRFLLKPDNYNVHGCDHPDVNIYIEQLAYLLSSQTHILLGLQPHLVQGIPEVFSLEMMHLSGANMTVLWLDLWHGTFDSTWHLAVLKDQATWEAHRHAVAACKSYLPGSFNVAPHDPSLHSNSCWIYCLCPALLYGILPDCPWQNFCWFCHMNCIPFICSCVHLTLHWTMERTIGNLGQEIQQPSDSFSNLTQQGIQHCQVNALKAMIPHLDPPENTNPCASADLGNGYILLTKHDKLLTTVQGEEAASKHQELQRAPEDIHMACNVKVYWFQFANVALITLYSDSHPYLLDQSYGVLASCTKLGAASLQVIEILAIQSVVAMVPHCPMVHGIAKDRYFLVEKTGMEIAHFGLEENDE
ncbi:hypothetical protein J3A83DRAFT_4356622 [Scleroderma citrinum]